MSRPWILRLTAAVLAALLVISLRQPLARGLLAAGIAARDRGEPLRAVRLLSLAGRIARGYSADLELAAALADRGDRLALDRVLDALPLNAVATPSWRCRRRLLEADRQARGGDAAAAAAHLAVARELAATPMTQAAVWLASSELLAGPGDDPEAAAQSLEQALALARLAGSSRLEAAAHLAAGALCLRRGHSAASCSDEHDRPALGLAQRAGDRRGEAIARSRLGLALLRQGEYDASEHQLLSAGRLQHRVGDLGSLADTHAWLGVLEVTRRRSRQAHAHYRRSLELATRLGAQRTANSTRYLLADYFVRAGDYAQAVATCEGVLASPVPPWPAERRRLLVTAANAALHQGDSAAALARYRQALAEMPPGRDDTLRLQATLMVGHTMLERGDPMAAAEAFDQAATLAAASGDWAQLVFITLARADLADRLGQRHRALRHLATAAEVEARTFGTARTLFYRSQYWQVFRRIRALLFDGRASSGERDSAARLLFRFLEQMRYRSLRSLLVRRAVPATGPAAEPTRVAPGAEPASTSPDRQPWGERIGPRGAVAAIPELGSDDFDRVLAAYEQAQITASLAAPARATLALARPVELAAVQQRLGDDTALVEYLFTDEEAFALVVTAAGLDVVALPLARPAIEVKVRLLRALLAPDGTGRRSDWRPVARSLDATLIEPLRQRGLLAGISRLGVVPMGLLAELPFAVLERDPGARGGPGILLVESFDLFLAPSASVLMARWEAAPSSAPEPLLAVGRGAPSDGLAALPHAVAEAREVVSLFGGTALLDAEATEAELRRTAPRARVLHLATHGASDPSSPPLGRLALAPAYGSDGWLDVSEILALDLRADLVTLSGCHTGLSHSRAGNDLAEDDRTGLVEAFLYAGARSVVATLWPVGDRATARLMTAFYRELAEHGPAAGLARAQRALLAAPDGDALVSTWGAFIVVGSPDHASARR